MDLFEDCIEALKNPKEILSDELTEQYFETLNNNFPITSWAKKLIGAKYHKKKV
ncbi:hypothetical protein IGX41_16440 [Bacillus velezensis]|uniref:CDI toxin immunity protein n=1 Tax=Bacillus sp. CCNWLCWHY013 TaxID=2828479 RepID=UPI0015552CEB|nr:MULTISPECIES: hypothetical protein [Bacillus]MBD8889322.1 hypothetical protein [Bacillus velezensis]MBR7817394.1 hypothetical protein [Bacillus sp. CCNWLCWHY013]MCP9021389.1 hypothetical protein [Bacillus velezensis]MDK2561192.1 hypothetical protein [Bacillus amyloliquefaciens]MDV9186057.1 hypothetical protein [Bacillus sp. 31]